MCTLKLKLEGEDISVTEVETYDDAEILIEGYKSLQRRAIPYLNALLKLEHGFDNEFEEYEVNLEECGQGFEATYEHYWRGGTDTYGVYIPLEDMFDDKWLENAKARIEAKEKEEAERKERERLEQIERNKMEEYAQYMKLKEKFEK